MLKKVSVETTSKEADMPVIRVFLFYLFALQSVVCRCRLLWIVIMLVLFPVGSSSVLAQDQSGAADEPTVSQESGEDASGDLLELPPEVIDGSPILQEWLEQIPDIADEILHEPSFPTRLRLGYAYFPSTAQVGGIQVGLEDWHVLEESRLTVSGSYARSWNGQRQDYGAEARYYLLPLGGYLNVAPVVGYRYLETSRYTTDGLNLGFRVLLVPSRGGGADVAVSQTWLAPGSGDEVGLTSISVGYGVTQKLRLATDIQFQNSRVGQDSRLGILIEYVP